MWCCWIYTDHNSSATRVPCSEYRTARVFTSVTSPLDTLLGADF